MNCIKNACFYLKYQELVVGRILANYLKRIYAIYLARLKFHFGYGIVNTRTYVWFCVGLIAVYGMAFVNEEFDSATGIIV